MKSKVDLPALLEVDLGPETTGSTQPERSLPSHPPPHRGRFELPRDSVQVQRGEGKKGRGDGKLLPYRA